MTDSNPEVHVLVEGVREDLRRVGAELQLVVEDLEHAESLLLIEFNEGGQSGLRAEVIATIRRARLRLIAAMV